MARRRVRAIAVVVLAGTLLSLPGAVPPGRADHVDDTKRGLDRQIAQLRDELEGASADLVTAAVALQRSQAQLADARTALVAAQRDRAEAVTRDQEIGTRLEFAEAQLDQAGQDLTAQQLAQERSREAVGAIAREAYAGNQLSGLSVALQATSPEQFSDRMAIAGVALRAQDGAITRYAVVEADLRARSARLDAVRAQVADLKRQSEVVVSARLAAERQAGSAQAAVARLVTQEAAQVAAVQGRIGAEKARLASLEAEQAALQAVLVARARAAADAARRRGTGWVPPASSGFLSYAAPGPITSGFGMRYHPILHIYRMHTGIDFGVPCGTPVYASADGEIVSAGPAGGYGNRIVVDHGEVRGGDLATTYNHLSRILVSGGTVRRHQLIAYSGTTGLSTGCHLHFETLLDGRYVNPMSYL